MEQEKDCWDKFSVLTTLFSSIFLSIAFYCTTVHYQKKQADIDNNLKRIDLLEKLLPSLSSKDPVQNKACIVLK
jgi:hypothetical protein